MKFAALSFIASLWLYSYRGENVLLFLVQTVGRQLVEQRQFTRRARSTVVRKSSNPADTDPAMPEHDLEPPRFARKALERILNDWTAVKAMLLTGYSSQLEESNRYTALHILSFFLSDSLIHVSHSFDHLCQTATSSDESCYPRK